MSFYSLKKINAIPAIIPPIKVSKKIMIRAGIVNVTIGFLQYIINS